LEAALCRGRARVTRGLGRPCRSRRERCGRRRRDGGFGGRAGLRWLRLPALILLAHVRSTPTKLTTSDESSGGAASAGPRDLLHQLLHLAELLDQPVDLGQVGSGAGGDPT